jgi:hypothetical protein
VSAPEDLPPVVRLVPLAERRVEADREEQGRDVRMALAALEAAAEIVRREGCEGLAIAFVVPGGDVGTLHSRRVTNVPALVGAVAVLQRRVLDCMEEEPT